MYRNRFYRDPGFGEGAGNEPTQEELDNQKFLQEQEELKKEAYEGDVLKPGYILGLDGQVIKDTNYQPPVEGVKEDGTLEDGYQKNEDGTVTKVVTTEDEPDLEEATSFFEAVHAITGRPIEVDYGTVDPISPEGIALREKVVRDSAIEEWDNNLRVSNPRAYAYFLHTELGRPDEEFFAEKASNITDKTQLETSADLQAKLIKEDLLFKGVPEEAAQMTVDAYIKANTLKERALAVYAIQEQNQLEQLARIETESKENQRKFQEQVTNILGLVDNSISSGSLKYIVPDAKQPEFAEFVKSKIQYGQDGNFYFTQPITAKDLNAVIESLFVQFSGGNLKAIVQKEATNITTKRLKLNVQKDRVAQSSGADVRKDKTDYVPLGEYLQS